MEKKTLILSAIIAPVLAIAAMVLLVIIPGKSVSTSKSFDSDSDSDSKENTEQVDITEYSELGKYNYSYNEALGISQKNGGPKGALAVYLDSYYAIVGEPEGSNKVVEQEEAVAEVPDDAEVVDEFYVPDGNFSGSGSIDKYGIGMEILISEPEAEGSYWYTKNGSGNRLSLYGTFKNGILYLTEYADNGSMTGYFEGTFDGNVYQGIWTNEETGKQLKFRINF